jgi:hypothetical protein
MKDMKFISGLKNCHVKGVDSLVISERVSDEVGMVRVFHATPGHGLINIFKRLDLPTAEFCLAPHNHRQDVSLELIYGNVSNWRATETDAEFAIDLTEYRFFSGILGKMEVEPLRKARMAFNREVLQSGVPAHMSASQVHTVQVVSPPAAWIVREGEISNAPSLAYNCEGWEPTSGGLYIPMTADELADAALAIAKNMSAAGHDPSIVIAGFVEECEG